METVPNQNPVNMTPEAPKKSFGPLIGIVIIIIVLAIGAFYFWGAKVTEDNNLPPVSSSDEVSSLETDLGMQADTEITVDLGDLEAQLQ
jgi:hypothetical protein